MKVVILAGGIGTRLSEETEMKPKPMLEIGNRPMLWHIMKIYSSYGFNDFVILLGYKGYMIKEFFLNYFANNNDITINLKDNKVKFHSNITEPWSVTLIDTGHDTMTGGRVMRAEKYLQKEPFMLTYGDGVSNINIGELLKFHKKNKKLLTLTAVQPEGRFGALTIDSASSHILNFQEKPKGDGAWINGGFYVCEPGIFDYIEKKDSAILERAPFEKLAKGKQLVAYKHTGFWKCMDTLRDKKELEAMWNSKNPEWKIWKK